MNKYKYDVGEMVHHKTTFSRYIIIQRAIAEDIDSKNIVLYWIRNTSGTYQCHEFELEKLKEE